LTAAVQALGKRSPMADRLLARLIRERWEWTRQSRADLVAEITKLADEALLEREKLIRGYGGNCSYRFRKLHGPDPDLDR
jgi:hypothetical protein